MRLEVVRVYGCSGEWCVTVDGTCVVGFAGPEAHDRALQHVEELRALLMALRDQASATIDDPDIPLARPLRDGFPEEPSGPMGLSGGPVDTTGKGS